MWQRFSFQQLLTWERNTCTQPRMLAATTNQITQRLVACLQSIYVQAEAGQRELSAAEGHHQI